ncbi:Lysine histidine transporter-like 8 [Vitis vinifera]|uniref:Lysine histidine transporter-like 8 n=1 Tax=Vitis vinifera TaxID=29760 RepID=A0A438EV73_VITVI|nr:Lysine histidine transporter-like 8 [Vitis vinifera]
MSEMTEISSSPVNPKPASAEPLATDVPTGPPVSCPPTQYRSRSMNRDSRPPLIVPTGLRKALHLTKLDPQDAWLPITESRNGNAYYASFHTLCSGIGIQALVLPVAFTILGWTWGIICLALAYGSCTLYGYSSSSMNLKKLGCATADIFNSSMILLLSFTH